MAFSPAARPTDTLISLTDAAIQVEDQSAATRLASPAQRRLALVVCIVIGIVTVSLIPEARITWGRVQAFLPAYQTAIIPAYALTGYLIYGH